MPIHAETVGAGASKPRIARRIRVAAKWILLSGAVIVVGIAVTTVVALRWPIPRRSGEARLVGLSRAAEVRFDARGVPHVRAATEADAFRVLGRLHAADRFFQMEMRRRAAQGRLAEILGPNLVSFDIESRRAGHVELAQRDLASLPSRTRSLMQAYADGINTYLESGPGPLELIALRLAPEPWTVLDSLAFSRFLLAGLSEAPDRELADRREDGEFGPLNGVNTIPEPSPRGSNAWAISGARTRSGKPILANDPHLALEVPGVWYAAHLTTEDGLDVAGLTLAGTPGVVIGHNGRVAWGITMAQLDDADVLFELVDVERLQVAVDGGWVPLATRVETIHVRGADDVRVTFRAAVGRTILGLSAGTRSPRTAAVLAFAPDQASQSFDAFLRAARASTAVEIESAWTGYGGPAINLCWAAADGHVGLRLAGAIPNRGSGGTGRHGDRTARWNGLVPDEDLPRLQDPPEGFVASANDDGTASGHPSPFEGFFASDDRVRRLRDVLSSMQGATAHDSEALQNDVVSRFALRIVERIAGHDARDDDARRAMEILRRWDGRVEVSGPSRLYHAFVAALAQRLRVDRWSSLDQALDDLVEGRDDVLDDALAEAFRNVRAEDGPEPANWRWGRVHRVRFDHPFSAAIPFQFVRNLVDRGPVEMPGDLHTPNVQAFRLGGDPLVRHIPSARFVADLGDPDASTLVLPLGQSAHRADSHYDDQLEAWASGRTFSFPFTRRAVEESTRSMLRLSP